MNVTFQGYKFFAHTSVWVGDWTDPLESIGFRIGFSVFFDEHKFLENKKNCQIWVLTDCVIFYIVLLYTMVSSCLVGDATTIGYLGEVPHQCLIIEWQNKEAYLIKVEFCLEIYPRLAFIHSFIHWKLYRLILARKENYIIRIQRLGISTCKLQLTCLRWMVHFVSKPV